MIADADYLQALRNCCRDEAAFSQLQQLLADPNSTQHLDKLQGIGSQTQQISETITPKTTTDITLAPADEMEESLQAIYAELREMRRLQAVLFHVMEHDLRPFLMGALMVLKNLLNQNGETVTIARSRVERMVQASDRQLNAISALLETYQTPDSSAALQPEPVEFAALSQTIVQDLAPLLTANQASITPQIPAHLPPVLANADPIQRVVSHLVAATLQHNPPGLNLTLAATEDAGMLRCTLQDNGRGWDSSDCDRLFDLQVRSPHAGCSTSLGVQLHWCQQIIQAYGGEIGVANVPESGAMLWFTLPLATSVVTSHNTPTCLAIAPQTKSVFA